MEWQGCRQGHGTSGLESSVHHRDDYLSSCVPLNFESDILLPFEGQVHRFWTYVEVQYLRWVGLLKAHRLKPRLSVALALVF